MQQKRQQAVTPKVDLRRWWRWMSKVVPAAHVAPTEDAPPTGKDINTHTLMDNWPSSGAAACGYIFCSVPAHKRCHCTWQYVADLVGRRAPKVPNTIPNPQSPGPEPQYQTEPPNPWPRKTLSKVWLLKWLLDGRGSHTLSHAKSAGDAQVKRQP